MNCVFLCHTLWRINICLRINLCVDWLAWRRDQSWFIYTPSDLWLTSHLKNMYVFIELISYFSYIDYEWTLYCLTLCMSKTYTLCDTFIGGFCLMLVALSIFLSLPSNLDFLSWIILSSTAQNKHCFKWTCIYFEIWFWKSFVCKWKQVKKKKRNINFSV